MSVWNSVRNAVDRVTGSAAHVTIALDRAVFRPGEEVKVHVSIKNGPSRLDARALLLEIQGVEAIDLPRHANVGNVIADIASSLNNKRGGTTHPQPSAAVNSTNTFEATITIAPGISLEPGQERKFDGKIRLPMNVQPTYEGKYARHSWRIRARIDIFGTDPDTGWKTLRVLNA